MKKRLLALLIAVILLIGCSALLLSGCGGSKPLTIWVGTESVNFYTAKMAEYITKYNETHEKPFPTTIEVMGVDTASSAAKYLEDIDAGADIFTIAHDNLGKLTTGSGGLGAITDSALLAQINADNPQGFLTVIKSNGVVYGVPYISQALVLYYNKKYLTAEDVKTWEGIWAKATANNKQALSLLGNDGYNNAFLVLATNAATKATTVKIYKDGLLDNCYFQGDDTVAVMRWGQRFFTDKNGAKFPSSSGWEMELKDEISLSLIGGAWNYSAASSALGSNLGIAILPTFTVTAADVSGTTIAADTVFQSGTFADCKIFVTKKNSKHADYLQDILLFLSSKEVQEESYEQCNNLPAYKNASTEFAKMQENTLQAQLARMQIEMFEKGIPQPFYVKSQFNNYYYSQGAPGIIEGLLKNTDNAYTSLAQIRAALKDIETIWKTGTK